MTEYCRFDELGSELRCVSCEVVRIKDMLRDAVWNAGAHGFAVGVSGGIDSAVALALCAKAVGPANVTGVFIPAQNTLSQDFEDAKEVCEQYGVNLIICPIGGAVAALKENPAYTDTPLLSGNTASRLRMTVLYNIAGARGYLVCGTSNRTEYMIGYSTKWGDAAADVQPLLHLYKKDVYTLAKEIEIPDSIINKAPSAGFFAGQTDEAEIGISYADLDRALAALEKQNGEAATPLEEKVLAMVEKSRHKRMPAKSLLY
ncbi:MAG TPA: NAD(+) synthase [Methanocorpusculum sp.]|nr:NAD(+) synthase [Methanocorpusculum sp.]